MRNLFSVAVLMHSTSAYMLSRRIVGMTSFSRLHVLEVTPDDTTPEEYSEWAKEEIQLLKEERLRSYQEDDDDSPLQQRVSESISNGKKEKLPDYMLKILQDFNEDPIEDDEEAIPAAMLPIVAIIGRPNTGKSTIVNRLTDSFKDGAIVHDEAGITRDRTYRTSTWNSYNFQVVDTGGIVFDDTVDVFAKKITEQSLYALNEATVAIMVVDGIEGVHPLDIALAEYIRKNNKTPLYVAVNKCESETKGIFQAQDFWSLGLGNPYPVSGIHGTGLSDLLEEILLKHMKKITKVVSENATNIAFVGRPNVGKSSLFNRLIGEDRSIVSDIAGTTRDTVDALLERGESQYRIIDTAGVRKRGKVEYGPEFFMVNRVFKAIKRSDVVILLLDATTGIVEQDRVLADRISTEGRACVIALNKWDIVPSKDEKTYLKAIENIRSNLPVLRWAEVVLMSAVTGLRTEKLFDAVERASLQFKRRIPTAIINEIVQDATLWMAPPTVGARAGRIYYCMQISASPPTFVFFVNDPALFTDNYQRFLERKVRDALNLEGTPIKMIWRGKALRDVSRATSKGDGNTRKMTGGENGWMRRGSPSDAKGKY